MAASIRLWGASRRSALENHSKGWIMATATSRLHPASWRSAVRRMSGALRISPIDEGDDDHPDHPAGRHPLVAGDQLRC